MAYRVESKENAMTRFSPHFFELYRAPEAVRRKIRAAYKKHGSMQNAADALGLSVAQLRVQRTVTAKGDQAPK